MKSILLFCVSLGLAVIAFADTSIEVTKEQDHEIRRMIRVTGMEAMLAQMVDQMMDSMKKNSPDVPAEWWDVAKTEMSVEEAMSAFIPLYAKYYTADDLRAINDFYETPVGQRLLRSLPQLMQEAMKVGERWGQEAAMRALNKIQAERRANMEKTSATKAKL